MEARKHKLRQLTQKTKDLIKQKRQQYIEDVQDSLAKSPKFFWSYHKNILRNRNSPPANTYNNITATTSQKKAKLFNEYFASVFLPKSSSKNIDLNTTSNNNELISDILISELEVEHFLNNLDTTKANGPDGIPPRLLKEFSRKISSSLCSLFNMSLATGCLPMEWKCANVIPIRKKDSIEPVTNYHPISLLPILSKVLKRCIFRNISKLYREINFEEECPHFQDDLDTDKCKILTISRKKTPIKFPYCIYGKELLPCQEEKDLGILVTNNLKWGPHIMKIVAKANRILGTLKRTCFDINNTQVRKTLYLTLVKSQVTLVSTYQQQPLEKNRRTPEKSYSVGAEEKTQRTEL
jgi:hypothetical protein